MKHIPVKGCIENVCPFFKRTKHYDYNDELTCAHPSRRKGYDETHMHEYEHQIYDETLWETKHEIGRITLPADCDSEGLFPTWCPLGDLK